MHVVKLNLKLKTACRERAAGSVVLSLLLVLAVAVSPVWASDEHLVIRFNQPSQEWEGEGLPIGNGSMGAVVAGGFGIDRLQFNEKTLWTGGPGSEEGYSFGLPEKPRVEALQKVRKALNEKGRLAPEKVAGILGRDPSGYGNYQTFGDLVLDFVAEPKPEEVRNYRRELNISRAVARVQYDWRGVTYTREYFASYPAGVVVVRLTASQPGKISVTAGFAIPDNRTATFAVDNRRIGVSGALNDNNLHYSAQLAINQQGGTSRALPETGQVAIEGADSVTLLLGAGTNYALAFPDYRGADPSPRVARQLEAARKLSYQVLLAEHEQDHAGLFNRLKLDLGAGLPSSSTPQLLAAYGQGKATVDRALEVLYFQYGRYLLIASSRPGSLPANLQGVWNHSNTPPWNADYHVNINLQMNYWPAEVTNLPETAQPFFQFVEALVEPGSLSARRLLGTDGWTLFLNTNPWGYTGVISWPTAFWQPEAGAWLAQHFYDHYRFTRDETFLRERAYPVMKSAATVWLQGLVKDPRDSRLVVSPSFSPEHGDFTVGAAMSQQLVYDLFRSTVDAAEQVGDKAFQGELQQALEQLDPGVRVGSWGQLQEWKEDLDEKDNQHRHVSHLFAVYPGRQISPDATPQLAEAAKTSLGARGDGGTGWAKAWKINLWARLLDGDRAHKLLAQQLKHSTLPNLWSSHPPFQIDGNFGGTAGVAEMLLQSHQGTVHFLPALPQAWNSGYVSGLRARGDITVDMNWFGNRLTKAVLRTGQTGPVTVRSELFEAQFIARDTNSGTPVALSGRGSERTFNAQAGAVYEFLRQTQADE